jgi:CheY-like chemotaxis protein
MPNGGLLVVETSLQPESDVPLFMQTVRPQSDKWVRISVRDTGIGMNDTVHTRVFEPFFTTKPLGKGTGLGLSICYGIAKQWDGEITIDSKPGEGTVVNVYLPMLENVASEAEAKEPPTTEYDSNLSRSQRILVVEDEDTVRRIVVQTLKRSGFVVDEASDGLEALQLLSDPAEYFDLLLTDIVMPAMTGIELAERMAELRPKLVVIFMSGYAAEIVDDGTPLPESAVLLRKPFSLSSLLRTVSDKLATS